MKIVRCLLPTLIAIAACTQKGADAPRSDTAPPTQTKINIQTLAMGLVVRGDFRVDGSDPWDLSSFPTGNLLCFFFSKEEDRLAFTVGSFFLYRINRRYIAMAH